MVEWRAAENSIFKRFDRVLTNKSWLGLFVNVWVEHLARIGSDHTPLLLPYGGQATQVAWLFRFFKFWSKVNDFKDTIRENWRADETGDVFIDLKHRMKHTKLVLSKWRKKIWGYFQSVEDKERCGKHD